MEIGKLAIVIRPKNGVGFKMYPPRFLRLVGRKLAIEFRFGRVMDSLKALETIQSGGKP